MEMEIQQGLNHWPLCFSEEFQSKQKKTCLRESPDQGQVQFKPTGDNVYDRTTAEAVAL